MTFKVWKLLDVRQIDNKIEQFVYIFIATDFDRQIDQQLDVGDKTVKLVNFDALKERINNSSFLSSQRVVGKSERPRRIIGTHGVSVIFLRLIQ